MLATKFVLVGDHYQLPPLVQVSTDLLMYPIFLFPCHFKYFSFVKNCRALKLEKMGWALAYFGGYQKHILKQSLHCGARYLSTLFFVTYLNNYAYFLLS